MGKEEVKRKLKKLKLTKRHWHWIIAALVIVVVLIVPVGKFEQFAEDAEQKLSILQVLLRALISVIKDVVQLLAEFLRL